ncbi:MAG: choline ABC transporter permease subunit [Acetobacteraceae bacterium]
MDVVEHWIVHHKIPVGKAAVWAVDLLKTYGQGFFNALSDGLSASIDGATAALEFVPGPLLILLIMVLVWWLRRSWRLALFTGLALLFVMNLGYWNATLETLSLVGFATVISMLVGVPLGIAAAHRPWLYQAMRPVLDLMQTLPTFVYLIPTLVLFGLGSVPGIISTIIFVLPAPIRLTHLGISSVPPALVEAGEAFGASRRQLLWKVELPSALPTILAGLTQTIMLSLSMVVIAALVGAGGLGVPVVQAMETVRIGMGFESGLAIVVLAVVLDRVCRPAETPSTR